MIDILCKITDCTEYGMPFYFSKDLPCTFQRWGHDGGRWKPPRADLQGPGPGVKILTKPRMLPRQVGDVRWGKKENLRSPISLIRTYHWDP